MISMVVGEFGRGETSIEILHLRPDCCYNIKILATNPANLTSLSSAIRIQTSAVEHDDFAVSNSNGNEQASIRTATSQLASHNPQSSPRDSINLHQSGAKSTPRPRNVPAPQISLNAATEGVQSSDSESDDSPECIQRLTQVLESLKKQKEEVDRQTEDEEAEAKNYHADLATERDQLKQELKEKEDASTELKRQGNQLDRLNRTAQSKKSAKEKLLQQKKAERQKVQDDVSRWGQEIRGLKDDIEEMEQELLHVNNSKDEQLIHTRQAIAEDQMVIKALEEEIRVRGTQIKDLEVQKDQNSAGDGDEQQRLIAEKARDHAWDARYQVLQVQLQSMWHALQQSKMEEQQAEEQLAWWLTRRARNPEHFAAMPSLDVPPSIQRNRSKRTRQANSRASNLSSSGQYAMPSSYSNAPPPYSASSPISHQPNTSMGLTQAGERSQLSQFDIENMTGGAPMSPAANDLLPSNLFRDEDTANQQFPPAVGNDASSGGLGQLLGHKFSSSDASALGPHTPASTGSRTGSVFTSPQESVYNVSSFPKESDRHSIHSANASVPPTLATDSTSPPTSVFANLFSSPFGRQRGKSSAQEPPALGTLKQGQSQSFPRNLDQDVLGSSGLRRRRGSHGTWANPVAGFLTRTSAAPEGNLIRARTGSGRSSRLNVFKPRMDTPEPNALSAQEPSSRPSSTYSFDQPFGRPSSESQNIWGPFGDSVPNRSSPLNAQWNTSHGPWSRETSRRPSVQRGSATNLSIGSTPLDADEIPGPLSKYRSEQAPIGTRPRSQRAATPKLNPAAPSFKTLFGRGEARKAGKGDKASYKAADAPRSRESERGDTDGNESIEDASPPNSRLSRDAQSIMTATSTAGSHESVERTASSGLSDATTPKESLMQKITRKSSSSKFNVPWSKDRGIFSKRAGEPLTPGEPDTIVSSEILLGKSADSAASTPNTPHTPREEKTGRAWPSMRRKSRKGLEALEKGSEAGDDDEQ